MKFFIGDIVNFEYAFNRQEGKVIALTEREQLPLVDIGYIKIVPKSYSYDTLVFISKSPEHIKWEKEVVEKTLNTIKKKNIFRRIFDKFF